MKLDSSRTGEQARNEGEVLRILLVDDHPVVREGIRASLESKPGLAIVGQASDGREAVECARRLRPDLILMDISMPNLNGLEATRILRNEVPEARVVILSVYHKKEYVLDVIRAGARGYVLKDSPPEELVRAIEAVRDDGEFFDPRVFSTISNNLANLVSEPTLDLLSEREREVLKLVAQGLETKQISDCLAVSAATVSTFRKRIMRKLNINNVAGLTKFAIAHGLIET